MGNLAGVQLALQFRCYHGSVAEKGLIAGRRTVGDSVGIVSCSNVTWLERIRSRVSGVFIFLHI